jgi:DNA mismatch repair protein MutL
VARIQQLPPSVISKIAAGEVIERPASVVKELLENSIDAGSTRIDIDLEQGGTELIRVVDDGCGILPEDLPLAFASHATSKLQTAEDLFRIGSLGFRGEALASIGGIARVTLQSRASGLREGAEISCNGDELSEVRPWNGAFGTRIEVRNLFFNVPVRKKFLRAVATELGHICDTVTKLALSHPSIHLVLRNNGRLVHEIPASAGLEERIGLFFGADVRDELYPIHAEQGPATLDGYIADPACDRGNSKLQYLFLNGRWIRDRSLAHALQESYRGLLMTGRYAVGFLFLSLPPDLVDVNVHPTKAEVRFRDSQALYHLVRGAVRRRLSDENLIPKLQIPVEEMRTSFPEMAGPRLDARDPQLQAPRPAQLQAATTLFESPRREMAEQTVAPWEPPGTRTLSPLAPLPQPFAAHGGTGVSPVNDRRDADPTAVQPPPPFPFALPNLGSRSSALQIHDAYLVFETPQGMLVIDQHALHERILFEQYRERIRCGQLEVQKLLIPEPVDLPADQAACALEAKEELKELGLEIEDFGGNTVVVCSYPTLLNRATPSSILKSVVDCLVSKDRPPSREQLLHHLIATMACKAAVKAGDRLTQEEIDHLMQLREMAEDSHHCPHGRPTSLLFSRQELDKQFRRT